MVSSEPGEPGQAGDDLGRARHEQGPRGLEKIALGVDVNEDLRTIEHGRASGGESRRHRSGPVGPELPFRDLIVRT